MRRAILVVLAIVLSASIAFARPRYEKEENPYVAVDKNNYYLLNETKGVIKITSGISFTYERIIDATNFLGGSRLSILLCISTPLAETCLRGWQ